MAEKAEKKPAEEKGSPPAAMLGDHDKKAGSSGGLLKSTPVLLGTVMVLEAALLFIGMKYFGPGPASASGADLVTEESHDGGKADSHGSGGGHGASGGGAKASTKKSIELKVAELKAPNKQTGRTFLYDIAIYVSAKGELKEKLEAAIQDNDARIKHHLRTIIAQADPEKLGGGSEPGLETLRRQVKYQLDEILGEGLIDDVLVPRCIPFRTEF